MTPWKPSLVDSVLNYLSRSWRRSVTEEFTFFVTRKGRRPIHFFKGISDANSCRHINLAFQVHLKHVPAVFGEENDVRIPLASALKDLQRCGPDKYVGPITRYTDEWR